MGCFSLRKRIVYATLFLAALILATGGYIFYKKAHLKFSAETQPKAMTEEEMDRWAHADGMIRLRENEVAVIKRTVGQKKSDKKIVQTVSFKDGTSMDIEVDTETELQVLEGSDTAYVPVKPGPDVIIKQLNLPPSPVENKTEADVAKKLERDGKAKVVIKYAGMEPIYKKKQTKEQFAKKKEAFEKVKSRLSEKIKNKGRIKRDLKIINASSAEINKEALKILQESPEVEKIVLDKTYRITLDESIDYINANDVWNVMDEKSEPITGRGKVIAIIDTGVDYTHPDLGGCFGPNCKVIGGYDFLANNENPMDDNGHGTHVAATAAGRGLLNGVAPEAKILAYKVCNKRGECSGAAIMAAIERAADPNGDGDTSDHADVISMSLGGSGNPDDELSQAVDASSNLGIVNVIAAGNSGPYLGTISSPGTARTAITVAAACKPSQVGSHSYCSNNIASFSSRGPVIWKGEDIKKPDVAAPGVMICAARWDAAFANAPTCFDQNHSRISGTSMATPHVAGAVALIRQAHPDYTPEQVKTLLKATATDLGMSYDDQGAGLINLNAAIPFSPKIKISPPIWNVNTDPTVKLTSKEQQFSVTSLDGQITTLDVSAENILPGVTVNFSKTRLNVASGNTDSFSVKVTVDADVLEVGMYYLNINLSESGTKKGIILTQIQVGPMITITPMPNIDFGNDNPDLDVWQSEVKQITVTNLRTDTSQTVTVEKTALPNGVTLNAFPPSIDISPGQSATFNFQLIVDNSLVPNNRYYFTAGTIGSVKTRFSIKISFDKNYYFIVEDLNPRTSHVHVMAVKDNVMGVYYPYYANDNMYYFHLYEKTRYQIIMEYLLDTHSRYYVFREDVLIDANGQVIQVDASWAKHKITLKFVDENGTNILKNFYSYSNSIVYLPTKNKFHESLSLMPSGYGSGEGLYIYTSSVSADFAIARNAMEIQPREKPHHLYFEIQGPVNGDRVIANTQYAIRKFKLAKNYQPGDKGAPLIIKCSSTYYRNCGATYFGNFNIPLPETLYLYTQLTEHSYTSAKSYAVILDINRANCPPTGACDKLALSSLLYYDLKTRESNATRYNPKNSFLFLPLQGDTMYVGIGPVLWGGFFSNQDKLIELKPYFSDYYPTMFLRQDFSWQEYDPVPYKIFKDNSLVTAGNLPNLTLPFNPSSFSPISISVAGVYEFSIPSFPYRILNQPLNASVYAKFDTSAPDKNPPAIRRLYFLTNNLRSEVYDENGKNRLEFEFDPVGGEMKDYRALYSADGVDFNSLPVSFAGASGATAILPVISGSDPITLRIEGEDRTGNLVRFTFQLPRGSAPEGPMVDTAAPAVRIVTPYPNDNPFQALQVGVNKVDVQAHDDFGATKVELYANGELKGTKTEGPMIFDWDTSDIKEPGVWEFKLEAKAYDAAGNTSASAPINLLVLKPDRIPPVINFISPRENENIFGTTNVIAEIYDLHSPMAGAIVSIQIVCDYPTGRSAVYKMVGFMQNKENNIWEFVGFDTTMPNLYANCSVEGKTQLEITAYDRPPWQPNSNYGRKNIGIFVANRSPRVSLKADKTSISRGGEITYTTTFENPAQYTATDVTIEAPIPIGTTYIENSASSGGVYDSVSKKIIWNITSVSPGQSITLTFKVRVD